MIDPNQLDAALADPAISGLSDADAAVALSVPILTPRTGRVTLTTLASAGVWGFAKATAFRAAITASTNPGAATLLAILTSDGFDATDPQAAEMAPTFVSLAGGAITDQDAQAALYLVSYRCGDVVQTADVTASRTRIVRAASFAAIRSKVTTALATWLNETVNPAESSGAAAPAWSDFLALAQGL